MHTITKAPSTTAALDALHDSLALLDSAARYCAETADGSKASDNALRLLQMVGDKINAAVSRIDVADPVQKGR